MTSFIAPFYLVIALLGGSDARPVALAAIPMATLAACEAARVGYSPGRPIYVACIPTGAAQ